LLATLDNQRAHTQNAVDQAAADAAPEEDGANDDGGGDGDGTLSGDGEDEVEDEARSFVLMLDTIRKYFEREREVCGWGSWSKNPPTLTVTLTLILTVPRSVPYTTGRVGAGRRSRGAGRREDDDLEEFIRNPAAPNRG
jgi:hypothetical protein